MGTPLELTCVVMGVPMPTVTWEKDGQLLAGPSLVSGNESMLHIESTEVGAPLFFSLPGFSFCASIFPSPGCAGG